MNCIHLGRSVIKRDKSNDKSTFAFTEDFYQKYGPRIGQWELTSWRAGRGYIKMTTKKYEKYLKDKFDKPFDEIQTPIEKELIGIVDEKNKNYTNKLDPQFESLVKGMKK